MSRAAIAQAGQVARGVSGPCRAGRGQHAFEQIAGKRFMVCWSASPVSRPTAMAPSSSNWAPSVKDSCSTLERAAPPDHRPAGAATTDLHGNGRGGLAAAQGVGHEHGQDDGGRLHQGHGGGHVAAVGDALASRWAVAVMKVTALTEP